MSDLVFDVIYYEQLDYCAIQDETDSSFPHDSKIFAF